MLKNFDGKTTALISIKPEFVSKIISGEKKVEFRKKDFKKDVSQLVIYSSSPVQRIVAIADVKLIHKSTVNKTWNKYNSIGGITKEKFKNYFCGKKEAYTIELGNTKVLKNPVRLNQVDNKLRAPQSYQYLSGMKVNKLLKKPFSKILT